jgi:hypothetical protein
MLETQGLQLRDPSVKKRAIFARFTFFLVFLTTFLLCFHGLSSALLLRCFLTQEYFSSNEIERQFQFQ